MPKLFATLSKSLNKLLRSLYLRWNPAYRVLYGIDFAHGEDKAVKVTIRDGVVIGYEFLDKD